MAEQLLFVTTRVMNALCHAAAAPAATCCQVMVERYGVDRAIAKVVTLASPSYIPPNLELLLNNSPHARQVNT